MKLSKLIIGFLFGNNCAACGEPLVRGEEFLCLHCLSRTPTDTPAEESLRLTRLPRKAPIGRVLPWLQYSNSDPICSLIRDGKYNERYRNIEQLGELYAKFLARQSGYGGVDALVPVPMHWLKRWGRRYNQARVLAESISKVSGIPVLDCLTATKGHHTQTRQTGERRLENIRDSMKFDSAKDVKGLHVALVDDILTTGATLSEAIKTLQREANPAKISVFTLAYTPF